MRRRSATCSTSLTKQILAWPQIGIGKCDQINAWSSDVAADVLFILSDQAGLVEGRVPTVDPDVELVARWGVVRRLGLNLG